MGGVEWVEMTRIEGRGKGQWKGKRAWFGVRWKMNRCMVSVVWYLAHFDGNGKSALCIER